MAAPGLFARCCRPSDPCVALTLHIVSALPLRARRLPDDARGLRMGSSLLPMLIAVQLTLGVATYVAKYAFPAWLGDYALAAGYVIQEKSLAQSVITTAHVATGSLILFVAVVLAIRSTRLFHVGQAAACPPLNSAKTSWRLIAMPRGQPHEHIIADNRRAAPAALSRLGDYIELTKPRIAVLELVVVLTAGVVATWGQPEPLLLANAMLGTLLVAASASAANQWLERRQDARMVRTGMRPLPAGRLSSREAIIFSAACLVAGSLQLALLVNATCRCGPSRPGLFMSWPIRRSKGCRS